MVWSKSAIVCYRFTTIFPMKIAHDMHSFLLCTTVYTVFGSRFIIDVRAHAMGYSCDVHGELHGKYRILSNHFSSKNCSYKIKLCIVKTWENIFLSRFFVWNPIVGRWRSKSDWWQNRRKRWSVAWILWGFERHKFYMNIVTWANTILINHFGEVWCEHSFATTQTQNQKLCIYACFLWYKELLCYFTMIYSPHTRDNKWREHLDFTKV